MRLTDEDVVSILISYNDEVVQLVNLYARSLKVASGNVLARV